MNLGDWHDPRGHSRRRFAAITSTAGPCSRDGGSEGRVPGQRQPMHLPPVAPDVVDRVVLHAAVVPEREGARCPVEPAGEFRPGEMVQQEVEQRAAFFFAHVLEPARERGVDVERLAAGLGMGAGHGMHGLFFMRVVIRVLHAFGRGVRRVHAGAVVARRRAVDRAQPRQHRLHPRRERFQGEMHVREQGVAAHRRRLSRVQDGARRRTFEVRRVRMPLVGEGARVVRLLHHGHDLGVALGSAYELVDGKGPEPARERLVGVDVERLPAEEQDVMFEPRAAQIGDGVVVERS